MQCSQDGCEKAAEVDGDECYRHRISGVGFAMHGAAMHGGGSWNRSKSDWMLEHLGTTDDRELGRRGIERAAS